MGGCDQGKLELGQSCNGAGGPGGMLKDRWIRLEEKKRKGGLENGKNMRKGLAAGIR